MKLLKDLANELTTKAPTEGTVVGSDNLGVYVRVGQTLKTFHPNSLMKVGDKVFVNNGLITRKASSISPVKVYV